MGVVLAYLDSGGPGLSTVEGLISLALIVLYFWALIAIARWAGRKGHSALLNFFVGFFFSILLQLLIAALFSDRRRQGPA